MKEGQEMEGIGLVFAGGGGKGSYEIGVWKYLHEIGLDKYIKVVSGTSVGALNAALFVGSNYEMAENIWLNISQEKILTPKKISAEDVMRWLVSNGLNIAPAITTGVSKVAAGTMMIAEKTVQMIATRINKDYMFSRDGIKDMISEGLDCAQLQSSNIPCYVTCFSCNGLKPKYFQLNKYSSDEITTLLLASSAIPIIFPSEKFKGEEYCDGGIPLLGDNVPIQPVYDKGIEMMIVVYLSRDSFVDKKKFPNTKIIEIVPRKDLGDTLTGTLDFSPEGVSERLQSGYEDAKRIIQPMYEMAKMRVINHGMLQKARKDNIEFEREKQRLNENFAKIMLKLRCDEFNEILSELTKEK